MTGFGLVSNPQSKPVQDRNWKTVIILDPKGQPPAFKLLWGELER